VKLWDINAGQKMKTLKGQWQDFKSIPFSRDVISFSPDSKTLTSVSGDKTVKLWDIDSGKAIQTFQGHKEKINSVSFSPDGKTLASASYGTIILWNFDLDNLLVRGCGLIRNYLQNNPDVSAEDQRLCDDIKR
jgi:WD40 repeat protein